MYIKKVALGVLGLFSLTALGAVNQMAHEIKIAKKQLSNGMTVLVRPVHTIPKVSIQLWYQVGSKDEKTGEKGIAHLIEHMIFKGTTTMLSESDINVLVHKLSGSCNAFTSYDYTGYLFNLPAHNWKQVFPVMADCMRNCAFKEDHLSSEMKAVIQELKMGRDNYMLTAIEELISAMFPDHPYHYPIIGFKQDLWTVSAVQLRSFYEKHYVPNNATLVVVGDVDPEEVFKLAEENFASIPTDKDYIKEQFYHNKDISSKAVTIYRNVQQPQVLVCFVGPGSREKKDHLIDLATLILGEGKASRLHRTLVDELHIATSISAFSWDLFDYSLICLAFEPTDMDKVDQIIGIINAEIASIVNDGIKSEEMTRAIKNAQMHYYKMMENTEKQAYRLGEAYLATGDENYAFNYLESKPEKLEQEIKELLAKYARPSVMNQATVLPLPETEKENWAALQVASDQEDERILSARIRTAPIEPPSYALTIEPELPKKFTFPQATHAQLRNGMKVLYYNNPDVPKITLMIKLKAQAYYEPADKPGVYGFMCRMMTEGTKKYSATQLAQQFEERGMSLSIYPGSISMSLLTEDLEKGLELLKEVIKHPIFDEKELEKVRVQRITEIKNFWDEPSSFANTLLKERLYPDHPFSKYTMGTIESTKAIMRDDLIDCYEQFISSDGASIAIAGDLNQYDIPKVLEKWLGDWQGNKISDIKFPEVKPLQESEYNYPIDRDQVLLCLANLSIDRTNPDYDKLWIFDQILGGGMLGSMNSRLFQLREQSGLFYSVNGSLIAGASEQPGMVLIKTKVSLDRLAEAEKIIKQTLKEMADSITEQEFAEAKRAIINGLVNYFESNANIDQAMLFIQKYGFKTDYFDTKALDLEKITLSQVKEAVHKVLNADQLLTLRIGRV